MASYQPPTENLPIFDPSVFMTGDEPLTYNEASKKFLKYPNAQGEENLQAINVNGLANFNSNINIGSSSTANNTPVVNTHKADLQIGTGGQGLMDIECPVNIGGFGSLNLTTAEINLNADANILQNGGTQNNLNKTSFKTANGSSATQTIDITDTSANKSILLLPNAGAGSYNPATNAGNEVIMAKGATNGTETLELTTWSSTNSSIKVAPTSVSIGAGGVNNTPSSSVVCNGTSVVVAPSITYPDGKVQNSAFTGAGALTGSYTNTNMTIDANGKITALSNGTTTIPANISVNSIQFIPTNGNGAGAGIINNVYNTNGRISFAGSGGSNIGGVNAFCASKRVVFDFNNGGATTPSGAVMKYRITFTFFNGSNFGQTNCLIDFYPNRWSQGQQTGNQLYNLNNKINGNDSYSYSNATYAPSGRQYWTYQQQFSGVSGPNALFIPHNGYFDLYFCIPDNSYTFSGCVEALDTTAVSTSTQGITLDIN